MRASDRSPHIVAPGKNQARQLSLEGFYEFKNNHIKQQYIKLSGRRFLSQATAQYF